MCAPTLANPKKALKPLEDEIEKRRSDITARLARKEKVTDEERDQAGNLVEENVLVGDPEAAEDITAASSTLDPDKKEVVQRLQTKVEPSRKRKRTCEDDSGVVASKGTKEISGGNTKPRPSYREVMQAITTVEEFILTKNDPFARELEQVLAEFRKEVRRKKKETRTSDP